MNWIYLVSSIIVSCEILLRSRLTYEAATLVQTTRKIITVVGSRNISDHWKELVLPTYAVRASVSSVRFLGNMLVVISPIILFLVLDRFAGVGFEQHLLSLPALITSTVLAILYLRFRRR